MNNTQFHEEMTKITLAWANQEFDEAFDVIRRILAAGTDAMKAQCLLLSGMIKDDQHNRSEARADWLHALPYAKEGSFVLCSLQHEIGESYAKTGMMDQALSWYKSALITCANGDKFSCEPTLRREKGRRVSG
jgi:tetratricopeptide (TPR) repeat protein